MLEYITLADMTKRSAIIMSATGLPVADLRAIVASYLRDTRGVDALRELADQTNIPSFTTRIACDAGSIMRVNLLPGGARLGMRLGQEQVSFQVKYTTPARSSRAIAYISPEEAWDFACGEPSEQMMRLAQLARVSAQWRDSFLGEMRGIMRDKLADELQKLNGLGHEHHSGK